MRLQAKLALTVALAAAIAIVAMAAAFWVLSANEQRGVVDDGLLRVAAQPRQFAPNNNGDDRGRRGRLLPPPGTEFGAPGLADDRLFTRVRLTLGDNTQIDQGLPEVTGVVPGAEPTISTIEIDGERYRMAVGPIRGRGQDGVIQVARNIEDLESGLALLRRQIIGASLAGIALAALFGALVARRLSAPITKVADAAKEMSFGRGLPSPIEVTRSDEVGDLATSFNQMLAALELSRDQQRRLVADASHELRTPLTSLRLKLDLLDSTPDLPDGQRQELLSSSALEVEKLGDLVTELVMLATDPTSIDEDPTSQSLPKLVSEVAEEHRLRSGRTIDIVTEGDVSALPLRGRMVRRAVSNLIDNATKYSGGDAPVAITVSGDRVEVRDRGEGIADDELQYVFDRFYRSATARTRPGNGIGLAIVKRVAELHGGRAWARNASDPSGAVVGFSVADPVH